MNKALITVLLSLCSMFSLAADNGTIRLSGRVLDAVTKYDLTKAKVYLYDSNDLICDSVCANQGYAWRGNNQVDTMSYFSLSVPKVDSTFVYEVVCPGYKSQTLSYKVGKFGKRETHRDLGVILLERAPRQLKEVTVTSTKIKFYNKGDTLVYNADAFQLAEGSMLDELISQLPGAELDTDGKITINGKFVESLLLNGKQFFDGNNNLMLENIAAYSVKDIMVYEGQTKDAKLKGNEMAPKVLTMDVKLKKEYSVGWLINAQGGYGTEDRYLGKLFANWFNAKTQVSMFANVNNLNDNRKPGRTDSWTPDRMPTGTRETYSAGINYNFEDQVRKQTAMGSFSFDQNIDKNYSTTARTNFLPGGDTYENQFSNYRNRETRMQTNHSYYIGLGENFMIAPTIRGVYQNVKNSGSDLSAAFDDDPQCITPEIIEAIYSEGSEELLESILNRSRTHRDGRRKKLKGEAELYGAYKIPHTNDRIGLQVSGYYDSNQEYKWDDYDVNYGNNATAAVKRRQYTDNTPNYLKRFSTSLSYRGRLNKVHVGLAYRYIYDEQKKNSNMYALERLEDMGIYGVLPEGYIAAFDPANSYNSHRFENTHSIAPEIQYSLVKNDKRLWAIFNGRLGFNHRNFYYWRNNQSYSLSTHNTYFSLSNSFSCNVEFSFNGKGERREAKYRNMLAYSYMLRPDIPNLFDMVDVVDDSNPLNIYIGNPGLKAANEHTHELTWIYRPHNSSLNDRLLLSYSYTTNALTRGYNYDTATGIRYNKMYNVDGNDRISASNYLNWQFGRNKQFSFSSRTSAGMSHYADLIGVNMETPQATKVKYRNLGESLMVSWQIGKQSIAVGGDFTNRHTTAEREDFNNLNANHFSYGITGNFRLPAGIGINTDLTCYSRRGYGSPQLDTNDVIWNIRLSYAPTRNKHWVVMLDGFDMLHQLSNVNYAVTSNGRVVSYTNALPRYFMLSVQYRLNIQPKKR